MDKKKRLIMRSVILVLLLVAIGYTIYTSVFNNQREVVNIGDTAPNFSLVDLEGNTVMLSDLRGKGVFLNFWGTWCKPCEREMPYMENQYQVFKDKGVEIVAVNIQETDLVVGRFRDRYGLTFPIAIDRDRQVLNAYGVQPLPTTFLIDENGVVVYKISSELSEKMIIDMMERIVPNQQ